MFPPKVLESLEQPSVNPKKQIGEISDKDDASTAQEEPLVVMN